jgi:tetrahedral aminopeptidase
LNFELLKKLCETPGIASREDRVRELVISEMRPLVDLISIDAMGSVIGIKKATKKKSASKKKGGKPAPARRVMLAAHMDEIGFIVKFIDDRGFIRLQPVGGWDPRVMVAQRVYVHGHRGERYLGALMPSAKPIHMLSPEEMNKPPKIEDMYVDIGLPGEQVKGAVEIGDMVTMARTCERMGELICSKTLDDRVSVFAMIEALREVGAHACDILAVATVQEEVGLRGATTAAYSLNPDVAVALDITLANDFPGPSEPDHVTRLGKGAAIKVMDSSLICHPKVVRHFRDVADQHGIAYQLEVLPRGGTDAGGIQRVRDGIPAFTLSIPTRYVHSVNESAAVSDIEAVIALLARYLEDAHTRDYAFTEK